jgi:hypothetical protein
MQRMTSTTTSAKVPPGGGKTSAGKTPIAKKQILILCYVAGGIAAVVAAWFIWQKTRPQMPRMDAPTPVLAKYVMTSDFQKQPFDMQVQFMKQLDARNEKDKKELDKAFTEGRLTESDYRGALQMAWYGKHLARVEKYFSMAGPQRVAHLDEMILKKIKEDEEEKLHPKPPKENDISGNPSALEEKAQIEKWPPDARERWYQFEREYKARKKKIEEARAKTRPTAAK